MGRPGWHIECSVMSKTLLGDTIDIHAGGEDLQFPHHENEIAQSETLNEQTFANYWMHNGMITVDREKMSKSKGNFFLAKDIAEQYDMEIVRFWLLSVHYRHPIDFSKEVLEQSKASLNVFIMQNIVGKMYWKRQQTEKLNDAEKETEKAMDDICKAFDDAMDDDLNTADAISCLFDYIRLVNGAVDENSSIAFVEKALEDLKMMGDVLGILYKEKEAIQDEEILKLIEEREEARRNKDYACADEIRDQLKAQGIELKDTRTGVKFSRIS